MLGPALALALIAAASTPTGHPRSDGQPVPFGAV